MEQLNIGARHCQVSAYFVIDPTSGRVQDPRAGLNGYISAPRIADGFARLFVVPADSEQRDAVAMLFRREGTTRTWLSAGTAFPEDDLLKLGVPKSLWPYGDSVHGPA